MVCEIRYKASVEKDLRKLPKNDVKKIVGRIEDYLAKDPGKDKQLSGDYKGLYSFRVGNYRIIYSTHGNTILVLRITHRKDAYR